MYTLVERQKRGDLLMTYRVFSGKDNVDRSSNVQGGYQHVERGGKEELLVCDPWHYRPAAVKMADSVNSLTFMASGGT